MKKARIVVLVMFVALVISTVYVAYIPFVSTPARIVPVVFHGHHVSMAWPAEYKKPTLSQALIGAYVLEGWLVAIMGFPLWQTMFKKRAKM